MREIVECVLNISEGRSRETLESVAAGIEAVPGAFLLHTTADPDHNRSVYSFIGDRQSVAEAAFAATSRAVEQIDLSHHRGEHPRLGAADVIPMVPLRDVSMDTCSRIARRLGERIGSELAVPVYFYQEAALQEGRRDLASIRRAIGSCRPGDELDRQDNRPDFGPCRLHPTAGAATVGARPPLIAFNILLETADVHTARRIASRIREAGGGLPGVRAMGFFLARRNRAQVSMNVTDPERVSLVEIFERVGTQAGEFGTGIASSEIVGLVSRRWMEDENIQALKLCDFDRRQILEERVDEALKAGG